jgi:hypothetical protein
MASIALRPRSPSEIVDAAFQIMRAHYAQFVMCAAIAYMPWLVIRLLLTTGPVVAFGVGVASTMVLVIGAWFMFALMSAVLIVCASQAYLGDPVDVGAAVRKALPRLPMVMLGAAVKYFLMFVGLLFFLAGGAYVAARLFAVTSTIVLEDASVGTAFSRSSFLSEGRKWHVLLTLALVVIIYWLIGAGIQIAAVMFGNLMVQAIVTAVYTILVYPVIAITEALLYYDARIKSEGLDIQLMAGALDAASQQPAAS